MLRLHLRTATLVAALNAGSTHTGGSADGQAPDANRNISRYIEEECA